ncbi:MAG: hypothetical protein N3D75_03890 [Candidatus Aenigmarchaeota archaeon]|nr:hypothetical protein [Candidatus Aenigmarchaeota archaeon]
MVRGNTNFWKDYNQAVPEPMIFHKMNHGWLECKCTDPEFTDSAVLHSGNNLRILISKYFGKEIDLDGYGYGSVVAFIPNQNNGYEKLIREFSQKKPVAKSPSYTLYIIENEQDEITSKYAQL